MLTCEAARLLTKVLLAEEVATLSVAEVFLKSRRPGPGVGTAILVETGLHMLPPWPCKLGVDVVTSSLTTGA